MDNSERVHLRRTAARDQLSAAHAEYAVQLKNFYDHLIEVGFDGAQAFELTKMMFVVRTRNIGKG